MAGPSELLVKAITPDEVDTRRTYSGYHREPVVEREQHQVDAACQLESQLDFDSDILPVRKIRHSVSDFNTEV